MADDPGKNTADVPRPDTADTAHTAGGGNPSGNPDAPGRPGPCSLVPPSPVLGHRAVPAGPGLLGWLFWKQWQAAKRKNRPRKPP